MNNISYIKTLKKNWEIVALLAGIGVVIVLVIALFQPFQYKASTRLLVIQNQVTSIDAYTATKSAEKIGNNLSEVISSSSFYNDVVAASPIVAKEFSSDEYERRKEWKRDVILNVVPETGILELEVYSKNKETSAYIVQLVSNVLLENSSKYHGGGLSVSIQVIDDVIVYKYPVRPNILVNIIFALFLGFVVGSAFVLFNEARIISMYGDQALLLDEKEESVQTDGHNMVATPFDETNEVSHGWSIIEETT